MNTFIIGRGKKIKLIRQSTLGANLEVRKIIIEETIIRKTGYLTDTDRLMINRLNDEQKLTGEEIVQKVLESPRMPF